MRVLLLDGYVDEPAVLGVPPYLSHYPRLMAGALEDASVEWDYRSVDHWRADPDVIEGYDAIAVLFGGVVPGKYLRSSPMSPREAMRLDRPDVVIGGEGIGMPGFRVAQATRLRGDVDAVLYDFVTTGSTTSRRRTMAEWERWSVLGAKMAPYHVDFPDPLIVDIKTFTGCSRWVSGGCAFCIEPGFGAPKSRSASNIIAEIEALYRVGVRHFRLGGQTCFISLLSEELADTEFPKPNPVAIAGLLKGIRKAAPDLRTLHVDNANPGVIMAHPEESRKIVQLLVRYGTPGNVLAFGLESADPLVIERNNLNTSADQVLEAIALVNEIGRVRGPNGMPWILPGLNFISGLDGERKETNGYNRRLLEQILARDLWVRRVNLRQVIGVRKKFFPRHQKEFRRFKTWVRENFDHEMLTRVIPTGTLLTKVLIEKTGGTSFGRQVGSYPLLVGIAYPLQVDERHDIRVTDHGMRSITGVPVPFDVNTASLKALQALPGIGKKRAMTINRGRPWLQEELLKAFPDLEPFVKDPWGSLRSDDR